jgi:hypothetical protein
VGEEIFYCGLVEELEVPPHSSSLQALIIQHPLEC